jgi:hypothetical protein
LPSNTNLERLLVQEAVSGRNITEESLQNSIKKDSVFESVALDKS